MSPVSRKRKKKSSRRRGDATPTSVHAQVVDAYQEVADGPALDAESLTSQFLGLWWREESPARAGSSARGVIGYAARQRSPEALGVLYCLARLGVEPELREGAAEAERRLREAAVPEPAWLSGLGPVVPRRCLRGHDPFGEESTVVCEFERDGARHALVGELEHDLLGGELVRLAVTDDPDGLLDELAQLADEDELPPLVEASAEEVAGLLRTGLALLEESRTDLDDDEEDDAGLLGLRALALARLREMPGEPVTGPPAQPEPTEDELAAIVDGFLASPAAAELPDDAGTRQAAELLVEWGAAEDGRPLRIGPGRLDRLLHAIPTDAFTDEARAAFAAVCVAWTRYTAGLAGLPERETEALVVVATECGGHVTEPDYDPESYIEGHLWHDELDGDDDDEDEDGEAGLDEAEADAVLDRYLPELREPDAADRLPTPEDMPDLLARRMFAVPEVTAVVDGERYTDLDPADPDERRILIAAEHPEYPGVLGGDTPAEVDGVNPQLHIAAHEIVANQLWDDTPPETWRAAQRLLNVGMERMEVLHALASVAMEHVGRTMTEGATFSEDDYVAELSALGR